MTEDTRFTGRTWLAIAATLGGQAVGASAHLAPAVLAIEIAAHSGLEPSMIGYYTGLVFLASAIASLGCGGLLARHGAIRTVQVCVAMSAVGTALAAIGGPAALFASAIIVGLAYGPMTPASSVVLSRWSPPKRLGLVMSIKQTGVPLGYFATGVGMPLLATLYDWRTALLVLAGFAAATAAAMFGPARLLDERSPGGGGGFSSARIALGLVRRHSRLRRMAVASLAFAGIQVTVTSFMVVYMEDHIGLSKELAAWPLAVAGVTAIAGRIAWGWLADVTATARLLCLLPVLMALTLLLLLATEATWGFLMLTGLGLAIGFSILAWNGVMLIETARQAPPGQVGLATAGVLALTFLGSTFFPQALAFAVGALGSYQLGFLGMTIVAVAVGLWYLPDAITKK